MSASPPKDADVEAEEPSAETTGDMSSREEGHVRGEGAFTEFDVKEQDRWLPIANVARIMKNALPENAKIAKEAKECMQECVSEFISFITSEASEKCQQEKRKTVNGEDILFAMNSLGFENYAEALKIYLTKYRETQAQRTDHGQQQVVGGTANAQAAANAASTSAAAAGAPGTFSEAETDSTVMMASEGQDAMEYSGAYPNATGNGTHDENF